MVHSGGSRWRELISSKRYFPLFATLLLALLAFAAYSNTFGSPFQLDDDGSIVENHTIRSILPLSLTMPGKFRGATVDGRPLVNFTLSLNYLVGGLEVTGYHVFNLLVHLLNGVLLLLIVRGVCRNGHLKERYGGRADFLAFAVALLWLLHPLQTEAVTYVIQRAESLVSTFYLFSLLTLFYGVKNGDGRLLACSAACCYLGAATKEVIATAPIALYLFDAVLLARSWKEPLRRRWAYYLAAASSWLFLGWLMFSTSARKGTVGFSLDFGPLQYFATQTYAIVRYLRLSFWPQGLTFDYGQYLMTDPPVVIGSAAVLAALILASLWGLWRLTPWGLAGAFFFLVLSPTSTFIPITGTISEHRMYLPLASVAVLTVFGAEWLWRRFGPANGKIAVAVPAILLTLAATSLAAATYLRNGVYGSTYSLWEDTIRKAPLNDRAMVNFGNALYQRGRFAEALDYYNRANASKGEFWESEYNKGFAYLGMGKAEDAYAAFKEAERIAPDLAEVKYNLGMVRDSMGRQAEARSYYEEALRLDPTMAEAHNNLANILMDANEQGAAIEHYLKAIELKPDYFMAQYNLANAWLATGRYEDAAAQFGKAVELNPAYADAWSNQGSSYLALGRFAEAATAFRRCLNLDPTSEIAKNGLETALRKR